MTRLQPSFLLRTPPDGGWLSLDSPARVLAAHRPEDVRACLVEAEAAARGGAFVAGFVTYEAAAAFGLAVRPPAPGGLPLAYFGVFPPDHVRHADVEPSTDAPVESGPWAPTIDRDAYLAAVARIHERIAEGDTYQLNFTFRLRAPSSGDPRRLFDRLVSAQGGGWSAFADLGSHVVCSASPELFFTLDAGRVTCRPMKGTAARGLTTDDDRAKAAVLAASAKNQSENVMIVDLVRNDLGRVARVGSVQVDSLFDVERYPAQWQMTSTVTADATGTSIADIFAALFPTGSVTGAPKARSMEILRDLETTPRGIYTGAIGLIAPGGRAHFNVAIRTMVLDRARGDAEFGVGSGIVWESRAADEFDECCLKAAILTTVSPAFELLETLRWEPGTGYTLLDRHLARLDDSMEYFGFGTATNARWQGTGAKSLHDSVGQAPRGAIVGAGATGGVGGGAGVGGGTGGRSPIAAARRALDDAVAGRATTTRVRLLVDRHGRAHTEVADLAPLPQPLRLALAPSPVDRASRWLYHKTTARHVYDEARRARPDADAVLLWNGDGEATEGTEANLVVELDGRRVTPPVASGLLPGTLRAELLASGALVEQRVPLADLRRASRIWLINSVRGWMDASLPAASPDEP